MTPQGVGAWLRDTGGGAAVCGGLASVPTVLGLRWLGASPVVMVLAGVGVGSVVGCALALASLRAQERREQAQAHAWLSEMAARVRAARAQALHRRRN